MTKYLPEGILYSSPENKLILSQEKYIEEAYYKGTVIEARAVSCNSNHDLWVDLGCMSGLIPRLETAYGIEDGSVRDIAIISKVNKPVCFKITGFDTMPDGKKIALLSRKAVWQDCMENYLSALVPGDVVTVKITCLESFGAFVDIGCGISSLIPIDSISVSRLSHPSDRFKVGDVIKAVVKTISPDNKICLSHKELLGSWEQNAENFSPGETVSGIIRSIESYGIFVELAPNLAGLAEYKPGLSVGMQASVYIKSIIPQKMKIKLIIVDAFDAKYQPAPPVYYTNLEHIDSFEYAPSQSGRSIRTDFLQ